MNIRKLKLIKYIIEHINGTHMRTPEDNILPQSHPNNKQEVANPFSQKELGEARSYQGLSADPQGVGKWIETTTSFTIPEDMLKDNREYKRGTRTRKRVRKFKRKCDTTYGWTVR